MLARSHCIISVLKKGELVDLIPRSYRMIHHKPSLVNDICIQILSSESQSAGPASGTQWRQPVGVVAVVRW
uniref:Uncharacterized protein LOC101503108 isoform X2 n=1 Tax=Rhizophora mucronata TaxID=61149 RepID=A0A2P2MQH8_RHIMU